VSELQNRGKHVARASPERSTRTNFPRSVFAGQCERDSQDQASTVVGDSSFLASLRNTRQFETLTDGVGGGWVRPPFRAGPKEYWLWIVGVAAVMVLAALPCRWWAGSGGGRSGERSAPAASGKPTFDAPTVEVRFTPCDRTSPA
jgi:hypothetical protein